LLLPLPVHTTKRDFCSDIVKALRFSSQGWKAVVGAQILTVNFIPTIYGRQERVVVYVLHGEKFFFACRYIGVVQAAACYKFGQSSDNALSLLHLKKLFTVQLFPNDMS